MYIARSTHQNAARRVRNRALKATLIVWTVAIATLVAGIATVIELFDLHETSGIDSVIFGGIVIVWIGVLRALIAVDDARLKVYNEYEDVVYVPNAMRGADGTYDHYFSAKGGRETLAEHRRMTDARYRQVDGQQ